MARNQPESGRIHFSCYQDIYGVETVQGCQVSQRFTRHTHRMLGLGLIEQGLRVYTLRGTTYQVSSGQVFVIPAEEEHTCYTPEGQSHSYYMLFIPTSALQSLGLVQDYREVNFRQVVVDDKDAYEQLHDLHCLLDSDETHIVKKSELLSFLGYFLGNYAGNTELDLLLPQYHQDIVKTVRQIIETNYAECFSQEELAQLVCVSPYHLLRLFSRLVGLPPHIYQQQVRIRHAKQMLAQGNTLLQTAMGTGFADQSHFTKVFKRMVGVTPGQYSMQIK